MSGEYRALSGQLRNLKKQGPHLFRVEVWAMNENLTMNMWRFVNLERNLPQFSGKPLLVAYTKIGDGIGDGHNFEEGRDPKTGEVVGKFTGEDAERIVGALDDGAEDIRLEVVDGNTWVVGTGYLWSWYARELVEKIERLAQQGRGMSVSIEALVSKSHMDGDVEIEEEYEVLGVTILGDHVKPAVPNARVVALQAAGEQLKELKLRAASYIEQAPAAGELEPQQNEQVHGKGVNKLEVYNKKQIAALSPKFAGYTVLAAGLEEGGVRVCLMAEDGTAAIYTMGAEDEVVRPDKIQKLNARVLFKFSDECCMEVDSCEMTDCVAGNLEQVNASLATAKASLEQANAMVKTMQEAEEKRRVKAAEIAAERTLSSFNANRAETVESSVLDSVKADIKAGKYASFTAEDGTWNGETEVEKAVKALCADAVMAFDQKTAQKNRTVHLWDRLNNNSGSTDNGSVEALLAKRGISNEN